MIACSYNNTKKKKGGCLLGDDGPLHDVPGGGALQKHGRHGLC
jgi:hypothetical protein